MKKASILSSSTQTDEFHYHPVTFRETYASILSSSTQTLSKIGFFDLNSLYLFSYSLKIENLKSFMGKAF